MASCTCRHAIFVTVVAILVGDRSAPPLTPSLDNVCKLIKYQCAWKLSVCLVSIQPEPPQQVLTFGSNATYECQAQEDLANFDRIKWTVTIGGEEYNEIAQIPQRYGIAKHYTVIVQLLFLVLGIEYRHNRTLRFISLYIPIRENGVNTDTTVLCTVISSGNTETNSHGPQEILVQG